MATLLRLWRHEVEMVGSGAAALEAAPRFRPDVVLLDIGLPKMDGLEVARRLRRLPALRETFLVALSGYGGEMCRRQAREAGCNCHFLKPIDPDVLQELLESCVRNGRDAGSETGVPSALAAGERHPSGS